MQTATKDLRLTKHPAGSSSHAASHPDRERLVSASGGFTLIELMIIVVVIAILAAIAFPSYQRYIQKARRTDAKNALLDLAAREERYFTVNNSYTADLSQLGYGGPSPNPSVAVNSTGQSYYTLAVSAVGPSAGTAPYTTYQAQAVPTGAQASDTTCATFQIDQLGVQTNWKNGTQVDAGAGCW